MGSVKLSLLMWCWIFSSISLAKGHLVSRLHTFKMFRYLPVMSIFLASLSSMLGMS